MDFAGKRKIWFFISLLVIVPGLISLVLQGLNFGIDFAGGNLYQLAFQKEVTQEKLRESLAINNLADSQVQPSENNVFIVKTKILDQELEQQVLKTLEKELGSFEILRNEQVGPSIGSELRRNAVISLSIAIVLMILYITIRFEFKFAMAAITALLHDVLITMGIFSIFQIEVNSVFIAAILTILGYSINATIVIFDRIRENLTKTKKEAIEIVVNNSITQTLARSINTTLTVLFVLVPLYFLGGETTANFTLALIIGVTSGAYSSILIASPLWLELKKFSKKNKNIKANAY
ncbi:MAG: protein translocase subunit SecF [Clostridia bacterium]|nr:protein translocase subunit SecF [Clostridia bacterium]